jgi:hypothetical protein
VKGLRLGVARRPDGGPAGLYLAEEERSSHVYVIGSTGVGKSKTLASWARYELRAGYGFGIIDPHGDLIADVLAGAVAFPLIRLIEFGGSEMVTLNPLERLPGVDVFTQTLELVDVFRKVWELSDAATPRLLEILRNGLWTLIEAGETLLELEPLLTSAAFRERALERVSDEPVRRFWRDRFERWPAREQALYVESTLNKASAFSADPRLRRFLGARRSTLDLAGIMDRGEILLADVSKGVLRTNTNLVGALLLSRIQMAAIGRLRYAPPGRVPWTLYVDEFQNYATESFAELLSEARKMGLRLILAHQSLAQLPERLRAIILGNTRNIVCFRVDREDAELLARYIGRVDPYAVKYRDEGRVHYRPLAEQWEEQVRELAELPPRTALLRTKGRAPRRFATLEVSVDERELAAARRRLSAVGRDYGWLRPVEEVDAELRAYATFERDAAEPEPTEFWESPRGSD